jgi:hypothetical protein
MKLGSKAWKMFMQKVYRWSISVGVLGLTFHYMNGRTEEPSLIFGLVAKVMVVFGITFYSIIWFLSGFEPIHEEPKWELVYAELALGYSDNKLDVEPLADSAEEIKKYDKRRTRTELNIEISKLREELNELKTRLN